MTFNKYSNASVYSIISAIVNGNKRRLKTVQLPYNSTAINVVSLLLRNNQISGYTMNKQYERCFIVACLRYPNNQPKLFNLKFISKPSRRVYTTVQSLRGMLLKARSSTLVISSPYGLISGDDAVLLNSGGEVVCVLN